MLLSQSTVRTLYTITIFLSAALLFVVEPMVARLILPVFGGSAQVWNSCLVFFQGTLLAGYGYAHLSTKWLGARHQWKLHLPLMVVACAEIYWQGMHAPKTIAASADPSFQLLLLLASLIGLPFLVVSAGSSILQRWFASTNDKDAHNPYFLYSASNVGSLLALLAYPALIEPRLGLQAQTTLWGRGLILLLLAMAACAVALSFAGKSSLEPEVAHTESPTSKQRAQWTLIAALPSSLLLGVTTYLSTNVAPIPLLWVVPLALYLITFILAFANRTFVSVPILARAVPLIVTPLALAMILESSEPLIPLAILHLAAFFATAWMCHARLSESKPAADHLTEFYFWIALGGVLGGIFNALIAPLVFKTLVEYPIAIVVACAMRPRVNLKRPALENFDLYYGLLIGLATLGIIACVKLQHMPPTPARTMICIGVPAIAVFLAVDRPIRYALSLGALFLVTNVTHIATDGTVVANERSFFGVHRVTVSKTEEHEFYRLTHGNTIHGMQDRVHPLTPLTYYYPTGPIGRAFKEFSGPKMKKSVALVGLGVGSLAAYGEPGQQMDYYEIDPVVKAIASDPRYFTFLRDSKAKVSVILGDARLSLAGARDNQYGLIALDAFSSDAIPVHLLTKEAFEMYLTKLEPHGVICAHISNRYLDLSIVLGAIARDLHLYAIENEDEGTSDTEKAAGKQDSVWVYLARDKADLQGLNKIGAYGIEVYPTTPAWTDDFSNVLSVFRPNK